MSAVNATSSPLPAMPSTKPVWRSWPGVEVIRPSSSTTTLPLSASAPASHLPAARPIATLSAPMKVVKLVAEHLAIEHDHRDARLDRLRHRLGERRRLLGAHQDEIDARADELLDVRALLERVVLRVLPDHLDLGVLGRGGLDVGVHLHAPRLAEVALAHADAERLGSAAAEPAPALGRRGASAAGGGSDEPEPPQAGEDKRRRTGPQRSTDFICCLLAVWVSTAAITIAPVSISRVASGTALMLRIFSR